MRWIVGVMLIAGLVAVGWLIAVRLNEAGDGGGPEAKREASPAAVATVPIERGRIELRRIYSGTLEARAKFVVAPKVGGRIEHLAVDLADPVRRGQVVAQLDDAEFVQSVRQAEADLRVARANESAALKAVTIAKRELDRVTTLRDQGIASDAEYDLAMVTDLEKSAAVEVAQAQTNRAESILEAAKIRLSYTNVTASWPDVDQQRVVAERHVDAGETITANTPLMTIIDLTPITGVIFATEKDYARLAVEQPVTLSTDAFVDRRFTGRIKRIAPAFRETSRQARIELEIENADQLLKPGMFIRAEITLDVADDATIVPLDALVTRNGDNGVFLLNDDGKSVTWRSVKIGIREGKRVQVTGERIAGDVVTLGQHLIDDGSTVIVANNDIPKDNATSTAAPDGETRSERDDVTSPAASTQESQR